MAVIVDTGDGIDDLREATIRSDAEGAVNIMDAGDGVPFA